MDLTKTANDRDFNRFDKRCRNTAYKAFPVLRIFCIKADKAIELHKPKIALYENALQVEAGELERRVFISPGKQCAGIHAAQNGHGSGGGKRVGFAHHVYVEGKQQSVSRTGGVVPAKYTVVILLRELDVAHRYRESTHFLLGTGKHEILTRQVRGNGIQFQLLKPNTGKPYRNFSNVSNNIDRTVQHQLGFESGAIGHNIDARGGKQIHLCRPEGYGDRIHRHHIKGIPQAGAVGALREHRTVFEKRWRKWRADFPIETTPGEAVRDKFNTEGIE